MNLSPRRSNILLIYLPTSDLLSLFSDVVVSHRFWYRLLILISIPVQLGVSDLKANLDIELKGRKN